MKVFAINLQAQTDKKNHIINECTKAGLDVEIIQAVDGRKLNSEQIDALTHKYASSYLTSGEVGCALSHLSVYQHIIEENIPIALVLEDDAELQGDVIAVLHAIADLDKTVSGPHVYLLSPVHYYWDSFKKNLTRGYTLNKFMDAYAAHGYVLNLAAAKELYNFLRPIQYEADRWGYFQHMGVIQAHCIVPPLILTKDSKKERSTIEEERLKVQDLRSDYFRHLRKNEMPIGKKIKMISLKLLISLGFIKVVRQKL